MNGFRRRSCALIALLAGETLGITMAAPASEPPKHSRELLRRGDVQVDVLIDGDTGPAVVLLPSSQRDSLDFDNLAQRIAASGYRVLRPQPRGMGRSSGPMDGLDLRVLARDVALTIELLGGGRAVIVGHAFGHFVARVTDLDSPERVRGVVVLGGAAREFPAGMAESLAIASDTRRPADERMRHLNIAFFAAGNDARPWLDGWHPELRDAYKRASANPPKDEWWPVSHAPVLDLQGDADPWRPAASRNELAAVLGGKVTVRVVAGASHAMVPERPAEISKLIVEWMAALPL